MKKIPRVAYTLEFKLEALRRVRAGEAVRQVGREIGVPEQSIRNWVKALAAGKLGSAEKGRPITPEQMEISRLRAEAIRLRMETEIPRKTAARFARGSLRGAANLSASSHIMPVVPEAKTLRRLVVGVVHPGERVRADVEALVPLRRAFDDTPRPLNGLGAVHSPENICRLRSQRQSGLL